MPHKRAKKSVRETETKKRGFDLPPKAAPGIADDAPKGALRILNAASARAEWKEKKRKREEEGETPGSQAKPVKRRKTEEKEKEDLKLRPGETLGDFNRRVDQAMTPRIRTSKASKAKAAAAAAAANEPVPAAFPSIKKERKTDFDAVPKPRRLNDIAVAPPSLTNLPRNAAKNPSKKAENVVSMATKVALEEERTKVVERYRMLKEAKLKQRDTANGDVT
ncbi:hypothetical protein CALVIDRAFT_600182 [Calocera viscosa TUFC12733]|uniref:Uncharacterized protein n=1 Tax=Calocera viscosa (strain TUFC12733) TaxID=1330018 RepID=A0A167K534_CALVF|nr:hypothetical protein CALVIDRAFT_600182 [Calocera viscosa TUFC12733]